VRHPVQPHEASFEILTAAMMKRIFWDVSCQLVKSPKRLLGLLDPKDKDMVPPPNICDYLPDINA